jgi:hypothetical protein
MGWSNRGSYYRWQKKAITTDLLRLSAHQVAQTLDPARPAWRAWQWSRGDEQIASIHIEVAPEEQGVRLHYNYQKQPVEPYLVRWEITTPHYGGQRYWWRCPSCGRRCAYLYGGKLFACRTCHNLTYASAQEAGNRDQWITRRMYAIRRRLGDQGALLDLFPKATALYASGHLPALVVGIRASGSADVG